MKVLLIVYVSFLSLSWTSCAGQKPVPMPANMNALAARLDTADYAALIYEDADLDGAEDIAALESLLRGAETRPRVRFLAAELLRKAGRLDLAKVDAGLLAASYGWALQTATAEGGYSLDLAGNAWGYLWFNDDPGLGKVFLDLGPGSIPALRALTEDAAVVGYEGSKEATTGTSLMPRVKDFAAYYLHRITGIPMRPITMGDRDFEARDAAIVDLLAQLPPAGLRDLLAGSNYDRLFFDQGGRMADSLQRDAAAMAEAEKLLCDATCPPMVRFLALQLCLAAGVATPGASCPDLCASALAHALAETPSFRAGLNGNFWGLLWPESDPGTGGAQLIALGEVAIPHLLRLLDDAGRLPYEGSEEATIGNGYQLRVKDAAAFYLERITGQKVPFYTDPLRRDPEIAVFADKLKD